MSSLFMGLNIVKSHNVDGFRSNLFKGLMDMNPMLRKFMGGGVF